MRLSFGTKAQTLLRIREHLPEANVPPLIVFTVAEWRSAADRVIESVLSFAAGKALIVRSSAQNEDSAASSHAGEYTSVANIEPQSAAVNAGIERVIASYGTENGANQFFVQHFISDVALSGVLFTRDQNSDAPYYVLNYDDCSGRTDTITAGFGESKTYLLYRDSPVTPPSNLAEVINAARRLESTFENGRLDIEFLVRESGECVILQVRPLVIPKRAAAPHEARFGSYLYKIEQKVRKISSPHVGLLGKSSVYSVMTDWNPAEMIGTQPRRLALSLYKELITDSVWAYMRHNYGYRDLRSFPLLVSFMGRPYIDVRVSFNSFVPAQLDDLIAEKLIDYYMDRLIEHPTDHDKVEFNIVYSCYDLSLVKRIEKLASYGFGTLEIDRIKYALLELTNRIMEPAAGLLKSDLRKLALLEQRDRALIDSDLSALEKIYWLIENCKRYGTLPFSGLARSGFIAVQMLRSLVDCGVIDRDGYERFMNSLESVGKKLGRDVQRHLAGELSRDEFLERYGHLRPGTYDILSRRYDEAFEEYFPAAAPASPEAAPFVFSAAQMSAIDRLLRENGLRVDAAGFITFIREAIEGRELGKFAFTRTVSEILRLLRDVGARFGITPDDLSHLDIKTVTNLYSDVRSDDVAALFSDNIQRNRAEHEITGLIRLPQLMVSSEQVYGFNLGAVEPNFITRRRVTEIVVLEESLLQVDLSDKVVFIRSADPGYDWIFSRKIAGLVTQYGGANSHMAIRCAELQIPAVIGCGEKNFAEWSRATRLELDCENRQVRPIC